MQHLYYSTAQMLSALP